MSKFVTIHSEETIRVTAGLDYIDATNMESRKDDFKNIKQNWSKVYMLILKGKHVYPAEIAEWPTVKALEKDKVLTVSFEIDETDVDPNELGAAKQREIDLNEGKEDQQLEVKQNEEYVEKKRKTKKVADINLADIAE